MRELVQLERAAMLTGRPENQKSKLAVQSERAATLTDKEKELNR